ncbi:MAG: replication initiation negative regulator SeqA [Gammaproteobacteria bacterium]|nr:replication initiation negative regulator SeqA [Gammaproteobacteria bacterium]
MKTIHIEDDLYQYIASQTQNIGESASEILRRLLLGDANAPVPEVAVSVETDNSEQSEPLAQSNSVFDLINKEEVATQKGAVGRFLFLLSALHRAHPENFQKVLEVKGRERNYFAKSAEELEAHGSSIKPKQIPDSEYWVVTNNNTPRKKLIINEAAIALGYEQDKAETLREFI